LKSLNLADCNSITGIVLWALCFPFFINIDLGRFSGITDTELEVMRFSLLPDLSLKGFNWGFHDIHNVGLAAHRIPAHYLQYLPHPACFAWIERLKQKRNSSSN
jgi:hypothetical protein